jgi:hypothetical protein
MLASFKYAQANTSRTIVVANATAVRTERQRYTARTSRMILPRMPDGSEPYFAQRSLNSLLNLDGESLQLLYDLVM